ncbi:MAG: aminotransferase class III-fold pyridoxal phosphate-dependent enzyme, partial [Pseudomonadota bacterium]
TLGHRDPDVNAAVAAQLDRGVLFSLPSPLETEVAELLVERVPCAEMVRFGKNGSDATAGCLRLARAHTRRDLVAVCGYHGWQDWYIGSTSRDLGVPEATKSLTKSFRYNDIDSLRALFAAHPGEIAAVIMEPIAFDDPTENFLSQVKETCHAHGALLIFDEVVTGLRLAPGSAQEMLGVTPDLAALGKGLANGFPLSAVVGRSDVMHLMEEIFFSFTMGGEAISLAAAKATLEKTDTADVLTHLHDVGDHLKRGVIQRIADAGLTDALALIGHPSWTLFQFRDAGGVDAMALKTLFMQECQRRGVLNVGLHFVSYAHTRGDIDEALGAYDEVFAVLAQAVRAGSAEKYLDCAPLVPLFKVRN